MAGKLLHEEITKQIIGAGMDVFNSVGPGWDEWDYHRAMLKALADRGLKAEIQSGQLDPKGMRIVAVCTGHGLKDPDIITRRMQPPVVLPPELPPLEDLIL